MHIHTHTQYAVAMARMDGKKDTTKTRLSCAWEPKRDNMIHLMEAPWMCLTGPPTETEIVSPIEHCLSLSFRFWIHKNQFCWRLKIDTALIHFATKREKKFANPSEKKNSWSSLQPKTSSVVVHHYDIFRMFVRTMVGLQWKFRIFHGPSGEIAFVVTPLDAHTKTFHSLPVRRTSFFFLLLFAKMPIFPLTEAEVPWGELGLRWIVTNAIGSCAFSYVSLIR